MADKVTSIAANSPETIEVVIQWVKTMRQHGYYGEGHARNMVAALNALASILGPEEPRDAKWFLNNLDTIVRRWIAKTTPNPVTADKNRSKAHAALHAFLEYQQDPTKFVPRTRGTGVAKPHVSPQKPVKRVRDSHEVVASKKEAPQVNTEISGGMQTLPLGEGKSAFEFRQPSNFKMRDVARIVCHLATLADDFDPTNLSQTRIYGIIAPEEPVHR